MAASINWFFSQFHVTSLFLYPSKNRKPLVFYLFRGYRTRLVTWNGLIMFQRDITMKHFRSSHQMCSVKKGFLRNFTKFTGKHQCQSLFFNKVAGRPATLLKKRLAQVFFCEFCEISKNTFLTEHLQTTTSNICTLIWIKLSEGLGFWQLYLSEWILAQVKLIDSLWVGFIIESKCNESCLTSPN